MQARLKVLHDKANVKQVKLLPVTLIGRSTDCNLKIASSEVSRNHCRITLGEDTVFVEDLGSANGTLVDGQALPPHQPTAVSPGAHLLIGSAEFLIDYVAPTSTTMVLSRSGSRHAPDLAATEVIYPSPPASSVQQHFPKAPAAAIPVAVVAVVADSRAAVSVAPQLTTESAPSAPVAPPETSNDATLVDVAAGALSHEISGEDTVAEFEFGESAPESVMDDAETIDATSFAFAETLPASKEATPAPTDPTPKKGGLKSLFSLFGRKEKPEIHEAVAAPAPPPPAAPAVFLPTLEAPAAELPPDSADPSIASEAAPSEPTDEPDDGFQQFLQQF